MKHNLHKMMAMFVASIFAVSAFAQEVKTDYTDAIKNAAATSEDGWDKGSLSWSASKLYRGSANPLDFNQTITLPAGKYKMTAQAAYRYAGSSDKNPTEEEHEYNQIKSGVETHWAKLYAATSSYTYEANVQNRWEGRSTASLSTYGCSEIVDGEVKYYVPNATEAVVDWFKAGKYVNELVFNVQVDGEVKIGVAVNSPANCYTNIGAWTLTRLGDAEADPEVEEEEVETFEPGQDVTHKIVNAQVTSTNGWTNASTASDQQYTGAPDNTYLDWCNWNWDATVDSRNMYQAIANMPAGYYTLKAATRAHEKMTGTIYATTSVDTYNTEIHHVGNAGNELGGGWGWTVVNYIVVGDDGKMTIGFETTAPECAVWAGADNFILTYLGATEQELTQIEFEAAMAEFGTLGMYECMYMVGGLMSAYEEVAMLVGSITEESSVEDIKAATAAIQDFVASVKEVDVYYSSTFSPLADECNMIQENSIALSEEAAAAFEEAYAKTGYMAMQRVSTVAELEAIVAELEAARQTYVLNALPINGYAFDYSFFLANPSFETGNLDGWTVASYSSQTNAYLNGGDKTTAGGDGDYLFNTWWQGVMLSQEAEGLPNGNYRLTASLASGDGGKAATIFLVANGEKKGFTMDHKGEFEDCSIEFKVTDGKVSIATIGGNDDASYNENGHWWYKSDNYRIHYLGDGGVTAVNLWTEETYIDEWSGEEMEYDLEWDTPRFTEVGATFKFEVEVEAPEDADKTITWSVSNDKVLSIDQTGLLTVIGSGSGIYEVIATAPNGICATCEVYVEAFQEGDITEMEVTCGGESWIEATEAGATYQLEVTYNKDATSVDLVWSSDDETVATVDQNGLVTIVGNGNTEVRVTAASGVEASITIWVEIVDDDVDGIKAVESEAKAVIYDLQGRRLQKMEKGLYIVNGRKVLVK